MNQYEAKRQARIARLKAAAERKAAAAAAAFDAAEKMAAVIPFGQPIHVGHHSESRDRSYRARIDRKFSQFVELSESAREIERRADAAESNDAIFSDDPDALAKLRGKLESLQSEQATMKAVNAAWKKEGMPYPEPACVWYAIADKHGIPICDMEAGRKSASELQSIGFGRKPYPPYVLSNRSAEMRRIRNRIATLERNAAAAPREVAGDGWVMQECPDDNRLRITFPAKPSADVIRLLKQNGFRWSPTCGAWQRQLNNAARYAAEWVLQRISELK